MRQDLKVASCDEVSNLPYDPYCCFVRLGQPT